MGSGRTIPVVGAYWMISASRVRWTTSPAVTATCSTRGEGLRPLDRLIQQCSSQVFDAMIEPVNEVHAGTFKSRTQHLGIGANEVGRCENVEELAAGEI